MSTKIEWCEETWNPIIGCSHISPGCDNCYAEKMAKRLARMSGTSYYREVVMIDFDTNKASATWNGFTHLVESAFEKPLRWKKPRTIFVCSMGDLFHESVPFEWIDKVMAIAAITPHTYLILTKRPERMKEYFSQDLNSLVARWENTGYFIGVVDDNEDYFIHNIGYPITNSQMCSEFPLSNVWLGVTAENQQQADKRIPLLLQIPAAKRFVSVEPMLGPVGLRSIQSGNEEFINALIGMKKFSAQHVAVMPEKCSMLDWVIVGGETGPNVRPMQPDWVRSLRDQCQSAGVPFFFKSWGDYLHESQICPSNNAAKDMENHYYKFGKKKAGHLLDGKQWRERP